MPNLSAPAVQQKIDIEDIQDGLIITRNGSLRGVLMTTAVNFNLKSTEEQDALLMRYQSFLNSLDFSVQILVVARQLDVSEYLMMLEQKRKEQENELLKIQAAEYVDFVKSLISSAHIMNQSFYVVVPLAAVEQKNQNLMEKISGLINPAKNNQQENKSLAELKSQLWQRINYVAAGLANIGLKATVLKTEEVTELFYHLYNMGLKEKPMFTKKQ
ncbi:MAG: hypothetical protein UU87_C0003G0040 [Parcubacteria group bacterium GW2011_GWA2_42_11]|nr:MAG: hypothetical protein UU87_C0003G0040 [Parcubacteria group bacterium GW2011_GWA2_42_11]